MISYIITIGVIFGLILLFRKKKIVLISKTNQDLHLDRHIWEKS
jgi:hypothetical protein